MRMRRKEKQVADLAEIELIIAQTDILHLAMVDEDGPYVVPLNFGYADGVFYIHGAAEGRRMKALKRDNRVCFALHRQAGLKPTKIPCAFGMVFESVVGFGKAVTVSDQMEKAMGLRSIFRQSGVDPRSILDFNAEQLAQTVVLRITVQSMTGKRSV